MPSLPNAFHAPRRPVPGGGRFTVEIAPPPPFSGPESPAALARPPLFPLHRRVCYNGGCFGSCDVSPRSVRFEKSGPPLDQVQSATHWGSRNRRERSGTTFWVFGQRRQDRQGPKPCWQCRETGLFGQSLCRGGTLRMRTSGNIGTNEARLSRVVTPLGRPSDRPKHLPTTQRSGGAPVVVADVSEVHMAKGCRTISAGEPRCSLNLEASRGTPENISGGSQERRIVWKAGCLETFTSGLGLGRGAIPRPTPQSGCQA